MPASEAVTAPAKPPSEAVTAAAKPPLEAVTAATQPAAKAAPKRRPAEERPSSTASSPGVAGHEAGVAEGRQTRRKVREGIVASNAMDKTAIVVIVERVRHPRYAKTVQRTKRLYAHDEANDVKVGDRVRLAETRPLSKLKRWRVEQVLERAR
jgi:small subunit ribosomal protein S17